MSHKDVERNFPYLPHRNIPQPGSYFFITILYLGDRCPLRKKNFVQFIELCQFININIENSISAAEIEPIDFPGQ